MKTIIAMAVCLDDDKVPTISIELFSYLTTRKLESNDCCIQRPDFPGSALV
jgi:hypothetical protein